MSYVRWHYRVGSSMRARHPVQGALARVAHPCKGVSYATNGYPNQNAVTKPNQACLA